MTPFHRFSDNILVTPLDLAVAANANGAAFNLNQAFGGAILVQLTTGASTGAVTMQLQVSATGSSGWTNFGTAQVIGAGLTNQEYVFDFLTQDMVNTLAGAGYVRVVYSAIGGTVAVNAVGVAYGFAFVPPTQQNTPQFIGHTL